jgi:hypothetical protein
VTRRRRFAALAVLALAAVACSGGGSSAPDTSAPSITEDSTTSSTSAPASTTTAAATTTTVAAGPVYPLTGLPVTDPAVAARPALVVKIDNNRSARPQSGLNEADIVFEEIVEVQTRFAAVFHSKDADPVGPIRSGRTQDIALLGSFNRPLFAWSGGNKNVTRAIDNSDLVSLSAQSQHAYQGGGFFRFNQRRSPHNLYAQTSKLWTLAPAGAGPPPQQFQYRAEGDPLPGEAASGTSGDMFGLAITWTFDSATGLYGRTSAGEAHSDALSGGQVTTNNVIVMEVAYRPSPADVRSPEAQTIGTGTVMVFTGGKVVRGTWTRTDRLSPVVLTATDGSPILLTPGRTFVELARSGTFSPVP